MNILLEFKEEVLNPLNRAEEVLREIGISYQSVYPSFDIIDPEFSKFVTVESAPTDDTASVLEKIALLNNYPEIISATPEPGSEP